MIVSTFVAGNMCGAVFLASWLADRFGRKKLLIVSAAVFAAASLLQVFSVTIAMLCCGRAISGLAIGCLTMVVPLYNAELVRRRRREKARQRGADREGQTEEREDER